MENIKKSFCVKQKGGRGRGGGGEKKRERKLGDAFGPKYENGIAQIFCFRWEDISSVALPERLRLRR